MKERVVIAGFGGQGVLFAGEVLANSGMQDGKEVTWWPSYGPEMRGGTANCHVTISDKPIVSPVITAADSLILMNRQSVERFRDTVRPDGTMIINSSLAADCEARDDVKVFRIPANDIAIELGNNKAANMVMLGAYIKVTGAVSMTSAESSAMTVLGAKKLDLAELNIKALKKGYEYIGGVYDDHNNKDKKAKE